VRLWNDVGGDHFADFPARSGAGIYGGAHGSHVAADDCSHQARVNLFPANEAYVCAFDHCIRGFNHRHEPAAFNQA
jgi:hypothetical protein